AVERQNLEAVPGQIEVADDLRAQERDHVRAHREAEAGEHFLGDGRAAEHVPALEDEHLPPGPGPICGGRQSAVAATDDDGVLPHRLSPTPPFITKPTRSSSVMSRNGSPATATRSASLPGSIVPTRSLHPRISAAVFVAEVMAAIGAWPRRTREANSRAFCPCGITAASVAKPIGRPAFRTQRDDRSLESFLLRERSRSDPGGVGVAPADSPA